MIKKKTTVAIIPARSGSKGLPRKNLRLFCGKPLIAWSIEAALNSKYIDEVIVSTDSEEIAQIARQYGAATPFLRPSFLATDDAATIDVIEHMHNFLKENCKKNYDYTILLEPTSPLRTAEDVDRAFDNLLSNPCASAIVGVSKTESQNPAFLIKKDINNFIIGYENTDMKVLRRQEISDVYFFEGSVYISETEVLLSRRTFYHANTLGYEFPKWKSIEIDDVDDFIMAEALMWHKGQLQ
jgi:N-acylneuraminate cytidylyltransferase/CMP-N,N'-diacetyllegionaminic acid synthase